MEIEYFGLLLGVAFLAGIVDGTVGGGGLLTLPALLFAGVPPGFSIGTSKFFAACGSLVSTLNFARKKMIQWPMVTWGIAFTLLGGFLGSRTILYFSPDWIQISILLFLPLAASSLFWKREKHHWVYPVQNYKLKIATVALSIGFYDGFFGPGTGALLTFAFYYVLDLDLLRASALAKPFNLISNLAALSVFYYHDLILWNLAIPMAVVCMLGNWVGSQLAIAQGILLIRKMLLGVCVILFVSLAFRALKACHLTFFSL